MGNCCDCFKERQVKKVHHPEQEGELHNQQELQEQILIQQNPNKQPLVLNKDEQQNKNDYQMQVTLSDSYTSYLSESDGDQIDLFNKLDQFVNDSLISLRKPKDEFEINQEQEIIVPQQTQLDLKPSFQPQKIKSHIQKQQKTVRKKNQRRSNSEELIEECFNLDGIPKKSSQHDIDKPVAYNQMLHYKFQNLTQKTPLPVISSLTATTKNRTISEDEIYIQVDPQLIEDSPKGSEIYELIYYCQKCNQEMNGDIYQLQCFHSYHKACLLEIVEEQIKQDRIKIKCLCFSSIQSNILRELLQEKVGEENALLKQYFSNQYDAIHKNIF